VTPWGACLMRSKPTLSSALPFRKIVLGVRAVNHQQRRNSRSTRSATAGTAVTWSGIRANTTAGEPVLAGSGMRAIGPRRPVFGHSADSMPDTSCTTKTSTCAGDRGIGGHRVQYVPAAVIRHAMNVSNRSPVSTNDYLDHRNRLLTLLKNGSPGFLASISRPTSYVFEVSNVIDLTRRGPLGPRCDVACKPGTGNLGQMPATLRRRREVQRKPVGSPTNELSTLFASGGGRASASRPRCRATGRPTSTCWIRSD